MADKGQILFSRLHGREQQYLLNVALIGHEHGKTINAKPKAARGWETVFQRCHKGIVHDHGFIVSLLASRSLLKESLALNDGIVQLCVRVGKLLYDEARVKK